MRPQDRHGYSVFPRLGMRRSTYTPATTSSGRSGPYDVSVSDPDAPARPDASGIRLSSIWVAAAFLLPITVAFVAPLSTGDLAYGIRTGRFVLETGSILRVDVFTFTAWCDPWLNQQWGAHVALAATFDALGWLGLALLRAALAAGVVAAT